MLLAAEDKRVGSLWICDTYFAYPEISEWLHTSGDFLAAVALGYPSETPTARPRRPLEEVIKWRR